MSEKPFKHGHDHRRGGVDPIPGLVGGIIAGMVQGATTTVLAGTDGFTVFSVTPTGGSGQDYVIVFDPVLAVIPVVLAGHGGTGVVFSNTGVGVSNVATTGFIAHSDDSDDWQFIAVVP